MPAPLGELGGLTHLAPQGEDPGQLGGYLGPLVGFSQVVGESEPGAQVGLGGLGGASRQLDLARPQRDEAPTTDGVLSPSFRAVAAASAVVLGLVVWVVLARAGVVGTGPMGKTFLTWATWGLVGFLSLNTVANLAAPHPVERWVMGSITLTVVALVSLVALRAP